MAEARIFPGIYHRFVPENKMKLELGNEKSSAGGTPALPNLLPSKQNHLTFPVSKTTGMRKYFAGTDAETGSPVQSLLTKDK
ncbi:MAG TPA: hypothetical protein VJ440_10105 [Candidatus Brocadiaceae bacterium]|nr:hypothetical protein [Candidatus Brocadiaceae bacterium]